MKNPIKNLKSWLAFILTLLVVGTLFGVIFIKTGIVKPSPSFFMELSLVLLLTLMMKIWWYDFAEDKRLNEDDIRDAKKNYYKIIDQSIPDSNELDKFLVILNKENRENYVSNKIGCRTPKNLAKKTKWMCFWHPSYKKLTAEQIGEIRYDNLYFKYQRKADKLRQIKSEEIMAMSNSRTLYDARNYATKHKRIYQTITTIVSFIISTVIASMAMEQIMLNWANVFRYVGYLCAMTFTIATTILRGYKQTGDDTLDYIARLEFIVDKFVTYKEKQEVHDGNNDGKS